MDKINMLHEIQKEIKRNGIKQNEVAEHFGVSQEIVSRWFHGKNDPSIDRLFDLAKIANLDITLYNRQTKELITGLPIFEINQEQKEEAIDALTLLLNQLKGMEPR